MGHPVSLPDDDIEVDKPTDISGTEHPSDFGDCEYLTASVQLANLAGRVTASIYGRRMQQGSFPQRVQKSLKQLTNWVERLPDHLQITTGSLAAVTPTHIISLHLLFNQVRIYPPSICYLTLNRLVRNSNDKAGFVTSNSHSNQRNRISYRAES